MPKLKWTGRKELNLQLLGEKLSGTQGTGDILCPFFSAHGTQAIRCRDIYPGAETITTSFESKEEKRFHVDTYCAGRYEKCWLYHWAMELQWEDMED